MISLFSILVLAVNIQTDSSLVNADSILDVRYSKNVHSESFEKGDVLRLPVFLFDPGNGYHFFNSENSFLALKKFLVQNPFLICELRTHTDTRGSTETNLTLSLHQSMRIKEEFLRLYHSDTLFSERLIPVGKGESEPIVSESYINQFKENKSTFELLHSLNRRSELCIRGFLGSAFYTHQALASKVFSSENRRNPAYYEDLIMIADRALLEGDYLKALEYYSYASDLAPADEHYATEQRDKLKVLLTKD